jgi:hypothetical protein
MPRAYPIPVASRVWFSDVVVYSIVLSTIKPTYRRAVVYPGDVSVLVALKTLSDPIVSIKGFIIM